MKSEKQGRLLAQTVLASIVLASTPITHADYVVTRAYASATNDQLERVFSSEVTRTGNTISMACRSGAW